MSVLDTLNQLRGNYGATMTDDECVDLINAAAWAHKDEGYGLSRKDSGTRGTRYDGVSCCHDVLMLQSGDAWDCLTAAGAQSTPSWSSVGKITDPSRGWVAPIAPKGSTGGGTTTPPTTPPSASCKALTADQVRDLVRAELLRAESELAWLRGFLQETAKSIAELRGLADQQETRREELARHVDQVIVERTKGWPFRGSSKLLGTITGKVGE